jgi:glyoxylase-like metal-dependent hydrolase (beta-lactamase superfamily II)
VCCAGEARAARRRTLFANAPEIDIGAVAMKKILLLLLFAGTAQAQSPYENLTAEQILARSMTELAAGLYSFGSFGERSLVVITTEGVIVTDPTNAEHAAAMRAAIAGITDAPVRYVVYSHNHWDHVLGGQVFKDEGATVVSHRNCLAHFRARPNPDLVMPDETVDRRRAHRAGWPGADG